MDKLNTINTELSCGSTAVVALIYKGRLFVANVGDSRALLCKTDSEGVMRVIQLSQDHVLSNEDEVLRLSNLGIPEENIRKGILRHYFPALIPSSVENHRVPPNPLRANVFNGSA